jgi:hypothetical protein
MARGPRGALGSGFRAAATAGRSGGKAEVAGPVQLGGACIRRLPAGRATVIRERICGVETAGSVDLLPPALAPR